MFTDTLEESNFQTGQFKDGRWYCECDRRGAVWYTSRTDAHQGEKFARCPKSPGAQCNFFLWGNHDFRARELMALQYPEAPRTPTRSSDAPALPTPNSGDGTTARRSGAFGWQGQRPLDASPTPSRFNDAGIGFTEHDDMTARVIKLLRSNNIELKSSTEVQLRHMISSEVGAYEIKLQKSGEAILELGRRLNELESAGAQITS